MTQKKSNCVSCFKILFPCVGVENLTSTHVRQRCRNLRDDGEVVTRELEEMAVRGLWILQEEKGVRFNGN